MCVWQLSALLCVQAAAANKAELDDAGSKLQQAIKLRDQQIAELREQLRTRPSKAAHAGAGPANSELAWLHEALHDELGSDADAAGDLMGA